VTLLALADPVSAIPPVVTAINSDVSNQATQIVAQAATSPDPWTKSITLVIGGVLLILTMAKPVMSLLRQWKSDKASGAADDANISTFERQTKQIDRLMEKVDKLEKEREELYTETVKLRIRVEHLEEVEINLKKLREKLTDRDLTITELRQSIKERDNKIMDLMEELNKTNNRVHELELRLAKDEQKQCLNCGASFNSVGDNLPRI